MYGANVPRWQCQRRFHSEAEFTESVKNRLLFEEEGWSNDEQSNP